MIAATTIGQGDRSLMDRVTGPVPDPVTRGHAYLTAQTLLPFKTGLYHLAVQRPKIDMVPVWIENLNRVMPKGEIISVPTPNRPHQGRAVAEDREPDGLHPGPGRIEEVAQAQRHKPVATRHRRRQIHRWRRR